MLALRAAQIDGDFPLQLRVGRDAEIMLEQHVFGWDRRVGFELEHPMPVRLLAREQRVGGGFDRFVESGCVHISDHYSRINKSAARLPDRMAPSIVAGRPVAVQSPASIRLFHCVAVPGRSVFCAGTAAKVARRSRTICQAGIGASLPIICATSCQVLLPRVSRSSSSRRLAALIVTESRSGKANSHSVRPLSAPIMGGTGLSLTKR